MILFAVYSGLFERAGFIHTWGRVWGVIQCKHTSQIVHVAIIYMCMADTDGSL